MPRKKKETTQTDETSILEQLLQELAQEIDAKEGKVTRKITKGQALIKSMVNEALKGDQRMMASVLKLIEKLDTLKPEEPEKTLTPAEWAAEDEDIILREFALGRKYYEKELKRLKVEQPEKWGWVDI